MASFSPEKKERTENRKDLTDVPEFRAQKAETSFRCKGAGPTSQCACFSRLQTYDHPLLRLNREIFARSIDRLGSSKIVAYFQIGLRTSELVKLKSQHFLNQALPTLSKLQQIPEKKIASEDPQPATG